MSTIDAALVEDTDTLQRLGYKQDLQRHMGAFSNFAISFSIICILAGGITSFHIGYFSVGGAAIGIGWPVFLMISLAVAASMAQIASAFPTAGGLYHWASILGGRGWGWFTAWLNLAGLVAVLAAINVGTYFFITGSLAPRIGLDMSALDPSILFWSQAVGVSLITFSQAFINHRSLKLTTLLTDFSGYLIITAAIALTLSLLIFTNEFDISRLWTFRNLSGLPSASPIWPANGGWLTLFAVGMLLPAYTITGFDASAHTSEETHSASRAVPRSILRSVWVSGLFGWIMLATIVLAIPNLDSAAAKGDQILFWTFDQVLPLAVNIAVMSAIAVAQYLCGLATVTSASRMVYAFARDGGLPLSRRLRQVHPTLKTPVAAIWTTCLLAVGFTLYTPVYSTITAVCVIFLYASYAIPAFLGLFCFGKSWTRMGPWNLGKWYRPLALLSVLGCLFLFAVAIQPPNGRALTVTVGSVTAAALTWAIFERRRFKGPPGVVTLKD